MISGVGSPIIQTGEIENVESKILEDEGHRNLWTVRKKDVVKLLSIILTAQPPPTHTDMPDSDDEDPDSELVALLTKLSSFWCQLKDPLDPRLIQTLDDLCVISHDHKKDLTQRYIQLMGLSKEDSLQIIDCLKDCTMGGYASIKASVKMGMTAYSLALARNAKGAISEIASLAADMSVMTRSAQKQQENYRNSIDHLAGAWNCNHSKHDPVHGEDGHENIRNVQS